MQRLKQEGYAEILVYRDGPCFEDEMHTHPVDTVYVVLTGRMMVEFIDRTHTLAEDERLNIPKGVPHRARAYRGTCACLIGVHM